MTLKGGEKLRAKLLHIAGKLEKGEVLRVGFLESAKYPGTGQSVAQVAFWNEYGTKTAPPRPFFRNAIAKHKHDWTKILGRVLKSVDYDPQRAFAIMGDRIGNDIKQSIVELDGPALSQLTLMIRKVKIGRTDEPTTIQDVRAAQKLLAGGEAPDGVSTKPLIDTNVMYSSVDYDVQEVG